MAVSGSRSRTDSWAIDEANDNVEGDGEYDTDENHADNGYEAGEALRFDANVTGEVAEIAEEGNTSEKHEYAAENCEKDADY